jgi:hypothetical protein
VINLDGDRSHQAVFPPPLFGIIVMAFVAAVVVGRFSFCRHGWSLPVCLIPANPKPQQSLSPEFFRLRVGRGRGGSRMNGNRPHDRETSA